MTQHDLHDTVSAGVLGSDEHHAELLSSIVEVARAIFQAKASSILLYDEDTDELVFEAVAGEGSDSLVGHRFPSSTGIAGFVLVTGQPMIIEDLRRDPRFAKDLAESTGFVPEGLMAVPLLHEERTLGVLEVLDRPQNAAFSLHEMDLLALFATQAAVALDIVQKARRARAALAGEDAAAQVLARLGAVLDRLDAAERDAGVTLLSALERLLARAG